MKTLKLFFAAFFILSLFGSLLFAQSNGDYETVKSGNWNDASVWRVYNGTWGAAATSPDASVDTVYVLTGHTVNVTADVTVDNVVVNDGGSIVVDAGVTLTVGFNEDGPGLDLNGINALQVHGTLVNQGNVKAGTVIRNVDFSPAADTAAFHDGSTYEHARNGGNIVFAKWEDGSTCLITGVTDDYPGHFCQNYHDFVWNCPDQTRGNGEFSFYRNRISGDFIMLDQGTQVGGDRDIRLTNQGAWPDGNPVPVDTIWIDGNVSLGVPDGSIGHYSRLATTGSSSGVNVVLMIGGNVTVGDSCVFGRSGSNSDARINFGGDVTVSSGGTIRQVGGNGLRMKAYEFKKQGTSKFSVADGEGAFYGSTLASDVCVLVGSGCTLDIGTTKIDTSINGFFVIEHGGKVKVTYGDDSGIIAPKGERGILFSEQVDALKANGNSFAVAQNVVGSGTITYTAAAIENADASKAYDTQWTIEADAGIESADIEMSISSYNIPETADWKKFVAMKYTGSSWEKRGDAELIFDPLWGDITGIAGATVTGATDLAGVWSLGEDALTGIEVVSAAAPNKFFVEQNYPNPFNPTTNIAFGIPEASDVTIKIYNAVGQEITTLFSGYKPAGTYELTFDGSNLTSGIYFYKIEAGNSTDIKRLMLVK